MRSIFLISLIICLSLSSCLDDSPCGSSNTANVEISFYSSLDGAEYVVDIDSITVKSPSATLFKDVAAAGVLLPLVPSQTELYVVFKSAELEDSVLFNYSTIPQLYAPGCDVELIYSDIKLLESTFDSVSVNLTSSPPSLAIYL